MIRTHLCKGCIEMLEEHFPYIEDTIEIVKVPQRICGNNFTAKGFLFDETKIYDDTKRTVRIVNKKDFIRDSDEVSEI